MQFQNCRFGNVKSGVGVFGSETNALIGDVQKCSDQLIAELEEIQPTHVSLFVQFGDLPQGQVMHSLEQFGETVLPQVRQHFPH